MYLTDICTDGCTGTSDLVCHDKFFSHAQRAPVVPVAITGARALFEAGGNRCHPGSVHIKVLPPIQTASMSKAEQKQLPDAVRQTILAQL